MSLQIGVENEFLVVQLEGPLNATTTPGIQADLEEPLADNTRRVVLDLTRVPFVSSHGLRLLIQTAKQTAAAGQLLVCGLTEQIQQMLVLAGLDKIVEIHDTVRAAVQTDTAA